MVLFLSAQATCVPLLTMIQPTYKPSTQAVSLQAPRLEASDRFQSSTGQALPPSVIILQQAPPKKETPLWQKVLGAGALIGITVGAGFGIHHLATHPEARERFLTEATSGLAWGFTWGFAEEAGSAFFHTIGRIFTGLFE
ncbi:MAG: hypothetical protein ACKO34_01995 [Vampirovibrionales bacterium]